MWIEVKAYDMDNKDDSVVALNMFEIETFSRIKFNDHEATLIEMKSGRRFVTYLSYPTFLAKVRAR